MKELAKKEENQVTDIQVALLEVVKRTDIDPERLEKFLDLQIKMEQRQAQKALMGALADFQGKCPAILKTKKTNNSKYAPLDEMVETIRPFLSQTGLSYGFNVEPVDEKTSRLDTTISHRDGASVTSTYYFPRIENSGSKNEAQSVKSALSYAKRAGLENALGLVTADEDTDGAKRLPEVTDSLLSEIKNLLTETKSDEKKFLAFIRAESLETLTPEQAKKAVHALKAKKEVK